MKEHLMPTNFSTYESNEVKRVLSKLSKSESDDIKKMTHKMGFSSVGEFLQHAALTEYIKTTDEKSVALRIDIRKDQYELLTTISERTFESFNEVIVSLLDKALYRDKSTQEMFASLKSECEKLNIDS